MQERRAVERFRISLSTRWETLASQGRGAVCDLSLSGCFVLAGADVTPGELVRLNIDSSEEIASLWGQVVYAVSEIGFAVRFVFGNEADKQLLARLVDASRPERRVV